jgi:hypothetical protein
MAKKPWAERSPLEQWGIAIAAVVQLVLAFTAWIDLARRPAAAVNGRKSLWAAAIAVNFVGPIAYFRCGRRNANEHTYFAGTSS